MHLVDESGQEIRKDKFRVPEKYRVKNPDGTKSRGLNGFFMIPLNMRTKFGDRQSDVCCVASSMDGWDHVSVQVMRNGKSLTPSWDVMQFIKDVFWESDALVVQYHPPNKEYVNNHPNVLHLWRCQVSPTPYPPSIMVGCDPGRTPDPSIADIYGHLNDEKSKD